MLNRTFSRLKSFVSMGLLVAICVPVFDAVSRPSLAADSPRAARRVAQVLNENLDVQWIGEDDQHLWYEAQRANGDTEIVAIDLGSGQRLKSDEFPEGVPRPSDTDAQAAAELPRLRSIERSRNSGDDTEIIFTNETEKSVKLYWVDNGGRETGYGELKAGESRAQHTFAGHVWLIRDDANNPLAAVRAVKRAPSTLTIKKDDRMELRGDGGRRRDRGGDESSRGRGERENASGRDRPRVFIKDHNVWKRDAQSDQDVAITTDGTAEDEYHDGILWSPDRRHFVVRKTKRAKPRIVTLVDSAPDDQLQPKTIQIDYVKPGDELDRPRIHLFSADGSQHFVSSDDLTPNPFDLFDISWRSDSSAVRFVHNERGHGRLAVIEMNVQDGKSRAIVDEVSKTFVDYAGKFFLRYLDDTDELIWMSERDGWNHLYLIDQKSGEVKRQITQGQWVVRRVVDVDEAHRTMLVSVGGFVPGEDPYYQHLVRVSFDGGEPVRLTDGDGNHEWTFSPTRRYLIDRFSRVDMPPTTTVRNAETGALVAMLEQADASGLIESGWTMPHRFTAKGRDGETDIYGLIVFPCDFDEKAKYPVLELIYAGPHSAHVPKSFSRLQSQHETANGVDGKKFVVVQIDGMGTSHRSKAFHDVCWKNIGDAGFPDRIEWMKAAAKVHPQMDVSRVGVWGGSAGGQNAMRALIAHGDFYKAAFADCGCHDNRMDKIWWNELWMSWPIGPHYEEQSNVTQAHRMQGKLMLSVGELDTNVDPSSTMQVVDALIKADKDFELLLFPGAGHGAGSSRYGDRRRMDFFRRALYP